MSRVKFCLFGHVVKIKANVIVHSVTQNKNFRLVQFVFGNRIWCDLCKMCIIVWLNSPLEEWRNLKPDLCVSLSALKIISIVLPVDSIILGMVSPQNRPKL